MTRFEDTLFRHLVEEHGADRIDVPSEQAPRRVRPFALTASAAGVAAAAAGTVLLLSGTTDTPPAYALTSHANGTDTLTLYKVNSGVSALNDKLARLGIAATVIPVESACRPSSRVVQNVQVTTQTASIPDPAPPLSSPDPVTATATVSESATPDHTPDPGTATVTVAATAAPVATAQPETATATVAATAASTAMVSHSRPQTGTNAFIAAEQQPNGRVVLAQGTTTHTLPSCFSPKDVRSLRGPSVRR